MAKWLAMLARGVRTHAAAHAHAGLSPRDFGTSHEIVYHAVSGLGCANASSPHHPAHAILALPLARALDVLRDPEAGHRLRRRVAPGPARSRACCAAGNRLDRVTFDCRRSRRARAGQRLARGDACGPVLRQRGPAVDNRNPGLRCRGIARRDATGARVSAGNPDGSFQTSNRGMTDWPA